MKAVHRDARITLTRKWRGPLIRPACGAALSSAGRRAARYGLDRCGPTGRKVVEGFAVFKPRTDRTITLTDGRTLAFAEWGVPDGPPVLFLHGNPHSRLWCPDVAATEAAGCRLITLDRPGYGRSDPPPRLSLRGWTDDVISLADALEIDRFTVIGLSAGGQYAAAVAASIPDRLLSAGEVSGALDRPISDQPSDDDHSDDASTGDRAGPAQSNARG
jgi:hypothetical protein